MTAYLIYDNDGETVRSDYTVFPHLAELMADRIHGERTAVQWVDHPDAGAYSVGEFRHPAADGRTLFVAEFHGFPTWTEFRRGTVIVAASAICATRDAAWQWLTDNVAADLDDDADLAAALA